MWRHCFKSTQIPGGKQDGRRGWQEDTTSALYHWLRTLLQALHSCLSHQSQRATSWGKGEERRYWNPVVINPARRLRLKICPLALFCLHNQQGLHFMQTTPPADLCFRRLPGKIWKAKKIAASPGSAVFFPAQLQLQGLPSCCPHCTEGADSTIQFSVLFCLLSHDYIMQLQHF